MRNAPGPSEQIAPIEQTAVAPAGGFVSIEVRVADQMLGAKTPDEAMDALVNGTGNRNRGSNSGPRVLPPGVKRVKPPKGAISPKWQNPTPAAEVGSEMMDDGVVEQPSIQPDVAFNDVEPPTGAGFADGIELSGEDDPADGAQAPTATKPAVYNRADLKTPTAQKGAQANLDSKQRKKGPIVRQPALQQSVEDLSKQPSMAESGTGTVNESVAASEEGVGGTQAEEVNRFEQRRENDAERWNKAMAERKTEKAGAAEQTKESEEGVQFGGQGSNWKAEQMIGVQGDGKTGERFQEAATRGTEAVRAGAKRVDGVIDKVGDRVVEGLEHEAKAAREQTEFTKVQLRGAKERVSKAAENVAEKFVRTVEVPEGFPTKAERKAYAELVKANRNNPEQIQKALEARLSTGELRLVEVTGKGGVIKGYRVEGGQVRLSPQIATTAPVEYLDAAAVTDTMLGAAAKGAHLRSRVAKGEVSRGEQRLGNVKARLEAGDAYVQIKGGKVTFRGAGGERLPITMTPHEAEAQGLLEIYGVSNAQAEAGAAEALEGEEISVERLDVSTPENEALVREQLTARAGALDGRLGQLTPDQIKQSGLLNLLVNVYRDTVGGNLSEQFAALERDMKRNPDMTAEELQAEYGDMLRVLGDIENALQQFEVTDDVREAVATEGGDGETSDLANAFFERTGRSAREGVPATETGQSGAERAVSSLESNSTLEKFDMARLNEYSVEELNEIINALENNLNKIKAVLELAQKMGEEDGELKNDPRLAQFVTGLSKLKEAQTTALEKVTARRNELVAEQQEQNEKEARVEEALAEAEKKADMGELTMDDVMGLMSEFGGGFGGGAEKNLAKQMSLLMRILQLMMQVVNTVASQ